MNHRDPSSGKGLFSVVRVTTWRSSVWFLCSICSNWNKLPESCSSFKFLLPFFSLYCSLEPFISQNWFFFCLPLGLVIFSNLNICLPHNVVAGSCYQLLKKWQFNWTNWMRCLSARAPVCPILSLLHITRKPHYKIMSTVWSEDAWLWLAEFNLL